MADFRATVSCPSRRVAFVDGTTSTTATIVGWDWDFGDGGSSMARNPDHAYAAAGLYTVCLMASDSNGRSCSVCQSIDVCRFDAGTPDAGRDAGAPDAGRDAGTPDAGRDAGTPDAGSDAGRDAGSAGADAAAPVDGGIEDDAGVLEDAGVMVAVDASVDASAPSDASPAADASMIAFDAGGADASSTTRLDAAGGSDAVDAGCACRATTGTPARSAPLLLVSALGLVLAWRKRRRR